MTSTLKRYKNRNMWIENDCNPSGVWSYDTYIGVIDWDEMVFYTWGYSRYSTTTSKQITMLCRELHLKRFDISEDNYNNTIRHIKRIK